MEIVYCGLNSFFLVHPRTQLFCRGLCPFRQGNLDSLFQFLDRQFFEGDGVWSCACSGNHLAPEFLVSEEGYDDCWFPAFEADGSCPCATMMHDSGDSRE